MTQKWRNNQMALLTIDVGGTSIKYASFDKGQLAHKGVKDTPKTLEGFYDTFKIIKDEISEKVELTGIAISCPGAVSKADGVIYGASAIPYIHNFPIKTAFEELLGLPVSVENDANCAALAEVSYGAGKAYQDLLFFVIGTGIGVRSFSIKKSDTARISWVANLASCSWAIPPYRSMQALFAWRKTIIQHIIQAINGQEIFALAEEW
jgi:N-acetylglucosamine kinase-like BadF-type ATPase